MSKIAMTDILSALKSKADSNLTNFNEISVYTKPYPTPIQFPALYIDPQESPKSSPQERKNQETLWHWHVVYFIVIVSVMSSSDDALRKDSVGLTERMLAVDDLFENDMLSKKLSQVHIQPESYSVDYRDFIDNIYTRAGRLRWEGKTIVWHTTVTRS